MQNPLPPHSDAEQSRVISEENRRGSVPAASLFGEDGTGEWADARIDEDGALRVSASGVARPVRVEYAWSAYPPVPCLYRKGAGLPLFPFRLEATRPAE